MINCRFGALNLGKTFEVIIALFYPSGYNVLDKYKLNMLLRIVFIINYIIKTGLSGLLKELSY